MDEAKKYIKENVFPIENRYGVHTVSYDEDVDRAIEIAYLEGMLSVHSHYELVYPYGYDEPEEELKKLLNT